MIMDLFMSNVSLANCQAGPVSTSLYSHPHRNRQAWGREFVGLGEHTP